MAKKQQPDPQGSTTGATKGAPLDPSQMSRRQQFVETYKMAKKTDPALPWWLLGSFVVVGAIGFFLFHLVGASGVLGWVIAGIGALLFGTLATLIVFGRRAQKAAFSQMEGQLGAGANALKMLRRGWKTEPAIAITKQQDVVHRVVGPPGIVLVGEGSSHARIKQLLVNERRRHERVAADVPIHEVIVGRGEDEVPLPKLAKHVTKLGRSVQPAEMTDILNRLKAVDARRSIVPMPKGPVPTSMKGLRGNMRGR